VVGKDFLPRGSGHRCSISIYVFL